MPQPTQSPMTDAAWRSLYRLGAATALAATVLFLSDVIVLTSGLPMIASAGDWFTLVQEDRLAGILQLFFTDLAGLALLIPFVLGLYAALRRASPAYSALAAAAAAMGIGIVFATNSNYSLIYLNNQYAGATTGMQKAQILAAGESLFTAGSWGTGYLMAGLLIEGGLAAFSVVMLRSGLFGKGVAWLGILGHGLDFIHSVALLILIPLFGPGPASTIGIPLLAVGGTLQLVWYSLAARRLLQLGRAEGKSPRRGI